MKDRVYESAIPNRILTAMILDDRVCCRVASEWVPEGLFESAWSNLVGTWCVSHAKKYNKAPGKDVNGIFENWATKQTTNKKMVDAIENFLYHLSDNSEEHTSEYILDLSGEYFTKVSMKRALLSAQTDLDAGNMKRAEEILSKHRPVNLGKGSIVSLCTDVTVHMHAFDEEMNRPLIQFGGSLGKFIGNSFQRGRLYSIMAPDKTGKTAWLIDLAWRAVRNRQKVLFIDTGDGRKPEVIKRFDCRVLGRDLIAGEYLIPKKWEKDELVCVKEKLEAADSIEAFRKMKRISRDRDLLRMDAFSSGMISASDINDMVADLDRNEDWRPDVVVVDYADILAAPRGFKDTNDQIDETWKQLRRLSQDHHCLVLTATQVSAAAYGKEEKLLGRKHFSGRKTKLAHVNGMLGLNVSSAEKDKGITRVNWIVRRDAYYNEGHYCRVAGNMALGCPSIISA